MSEPRGATGGGDPTPRRKKVAVLIGALDVGGAESDIVRNFPRLNRDEFEVVVVLFSHPGPLAAELERQGVHYVARGGGAAAPEKQHSAFRLWLRKWNRRYVAPVLREHQFFAPLRWVLRRIGAARYMYGVTRWVGTQFRAEQVDIAHFFLPHSYAYGMAACRFWRPGAKTVMSRLSLNFYKDEQRFLASLERNYLHHRLDIAIANSVLIVDELVEEGVPAEKVRLLHNGIDLQPFERQPGDRQAARDCLGLEPEAFVMLAVGNLHTYKGHRDLIEAGASVRDRLPAGWRLLIAGRDQEGNRAAYEDLVRALGLDQHVSILGPRDDVPTLLSAADVFVQPSHHEGLPNSIIEAMAASLPVIGTRVGGIPEAVSVQGDEGGATGWLVDACDVAALGEVLVKAAADPEARAILGRQARLRAERQFSIERSVADYEAIYRELLS